MEGFPLVQVIKRMVCLANSRKRLAGRCVAGRVLENGQPTGWIRPVSNREHEEVSECERQYQDGSEPRLLDVIDVPLIESKPKGYQTENWLLDPGVSGLSAVRSLGRISTSCPIRLRISGRTG